MVVNECGAKGAWLQKSVIINECGVKGVSGKERGRLRDASRNGAKQARTYRDETETKERELEHRTRYFQTIKLESVAGGRIEL